MSTFSVIVPVFNMQDHMQQCINSLLDQTFTNFEILLVNDGSTDNSPNICDNFASKDNRIKVFHKQNGGVSSARNLALNHATGDYIIFVDADDYVSKDMLSVMAQHIADSTTILSSPILPNAKNVGINFTENNSFNINDYIDTYDLPDYLWGTAYSTNRIKQLNLRFSEELTMSEDCIFNLQYFANYNGTITCLQNNLYTYNDQSSSACRTTLSTKKFLAHSTAINLMTKINTNPNLQPLINNAIKRNCRFLICDLAFDLPPKNSSRLNFINHNKHLLKPLYLQAFKLVQNPSLLLKLAARAFTPTILIYATIYKLYKLIK